MTASRKCVECRSPLPPDGPTDLCRRCLLKIGMEQPTAARLRLRCPHCFQEVEASDDADLRDACCQSCGGRFNVVDETAGLRSLGRFDLLERLGAGGFGEVWKAVDRELDRIVVVKVPHDGRWAAAEADQFLREARAAAQLRHPHIACIHEAGRRDGLVYLVSDFIPGRNLAERLHAEPFSPREAAELCLTIAEALHHAHEAGVVHRDLKPSNIMIDLENRPHLLDFGLAKREAGEISVTLEGRVLGTPAYMSPEQARGDSHLADRRSDVYSLGVILFELLTGERPFRGELSRLLHQVLNEEASSPRKYNARIPRDLETICLRCLEKDPPRRYPTAAALADDLRRFLAGLPTAARPVTPTGRAWRWCRRHPTEAVSACFAVVLLAAAAVGGPLLAAREVALARSEAAARRLADEEAERTRTIVREATVHYIKAFTLLEELTASLPADSQHRRELADVYADLAWFLAMSPDSQLRDPARAVELAEMAVRHRPGERRYRRTLGAARYRMGLWAASIEAFQQGRTSNDAEPDAVERLFTAMARWQLGERNAARECFDASLRATSPEDANHDDVRRLRDEARRLLQCPEEPNAS